MIFRPWDCAQPDEWLPRSLRLCWGGGGDGPGGGMGGSDGGGSFGGDSGSFSGPATGGGDWGSSGSYDASGFNASDAASYAAAFSASPGGFFDTGGPGIAPGALGAEFGGTFGLSGISGQPGTSAFGAELDAGGGGTSGVGHAIASWGQSTIAGPPGAGSNADLSGGGFSGYTGASYGGGGSAFGGYGGGGGYEGGGGGRGGGGGAFSGGGGGGGGGRGGGEGGGGRGGGGGRSGGGGTFGAGVGKGGASDESGIGAPSGSPGTYGAGIGKGGGSDETGPDARGEQEGPAAPAATDIGPSNEGAPAPSGDSAPEGGGGAPEGGGGGGAPEGGGGGKSEGGSQQSSNEGGGGGAFGAAAAHAAAAASAGIDVAAAAAAAAGADPGAAAPSAAPSEAAPTAQPEAAPPTGGHAFDSYSGAPYADMGRQNEAPVSPASVDWSSVFEAPQQAPQNVGNWGDLPGIFSRGVADTISNIPGMLDSAFPAPSWAQNSPTFGQAIAPGGPLSDVGKAVDIISDLPNTLNPSSWVNPQSPMGMLGSSYYGGPLGGPDVVGDRSGDLASQLGIQNISVPDTTNIDWSNVFEAPQQAPDWGAVFEGAAPPPEDVGGRVESFIPGGRETNFEYAPNAPTVDLPPVDVAPTQNIDVETITPEEATQLGLANPLAADNFNSRFGDWGLPAAVPTTETPPQETPQTQPQQVQQEGAPQSAAEVASNAARDAGAPAAVAEAVTSAVQNAIQASPVDQANAAATAAIEAGATPAQAEAIGHAVYDAATSPGVTPAHGPTPGTSATIPGGRTTDFNYPTTAPPSLVDMAQPGTSSTIPGGRSTDFSYPTTSTMPLGRPGGIGSDTVASPDDTDDDAPEPEDQSQPPQDPNAPRPSAPVPGQPIGSRGTYMNPNADSPRGSRDYRDSGRTDYPQGRPGVNFVTARQAGIEPNFRVGDINVDDLDARLVDRINRAVADMPADIRGTLEASSGYRPAHRGEGIEHGMDPRTTQESVYSRGHPTAGRGFPSARPGSSNHGHGRAIDFLSSPALTWLRGHAQQYGLETIANDHPHIQLQGARGNAGPQPTPAQRQEQQARDAQTRQAAIDAGLMPAGRGQTQQAGVPMPPARPADAPRGEPPPTQTAEQPSAAPPVIALPPQGEAAPPPDIARPPVDIPPAPPTAPAPFLSPPRAGRGDQAMLERAADAIGKEASKNLTKASGQADFTVAANRAAANMARAGIPANIARSVMLTGAMNGLHDPARGNYKPTDLTYGIAVKTINDTINAAMQGYNPAKPGEVQGPYGFQPDAPAQQRGDLPGLVTPVAGDRDIWGRPNAPPEQPPGTPEWENAPDPTGMLPDPGSLQGIERGMERQQDINQDRFEFGPPPAGERQASLLDFLSNALSNLNPISTAEARGRGRGPSGPSRDEQQAIQLAREGGQMGGQPGRSIVGNNIFTFYAPGASGAKGTEGPMIGSRGNPLTTLDDVRNGAGAVSLAGDPSQFGKTIFIGDITYTSPVDGKQYTLSNVFGRVDDTGSEFRGAKNPDKNQFDIAVGDFGGGKWNDASAGRFVAPNVVNAVSGAGIGSDFAAGDLPADVPAAAFLPQMEARAKGGPVKEGQPYLVGEEGPETFVPDEPGTVVPHMPQPGKPTTSLDHWPRLPSPQFPGGYGGVEREMRRQTALAQDPMPTLMDWVDSGQLRLTPNWQRMLHDPALIALGQSRIEDRNLPSDYGPWDLPPMPDRTPNEMSQQLGYDAIRRPVPPTPLPRRDPRLIIGGKSY